MKQSNEDGVICWNEERIDTYHNPLYNQSNAVNLSFIITNED